MASSFAVLQGATILDGTEAEPRNGHAILVHGDTIAAVSPADALEAPADAEVVDASGCTLIPGLIDVHAHLDSAWAAAAFLANGVTTVRNPATDWGSTDSRVERLRGAPLAPRMLVAGPPIDFPPSYWPGSAEVSTEIATRQEVQRQVSSGVDFIKLYVRLPKELLRAGVDEAHGLGKKAIGDLTATSWTEAAHAGIDALCHALPLHPDLLPSANRSLYDEDLSARRAHPLYRWIELADLDGPEIREMAEAMLRARVTLEPTLVAAEATLFAIDSSFRNRASEPHRWLPLSGRNQEKPPNTEGWPGDYLSRAREAWPKILEFVRRLHQVGIPLLAGTDAPRPWVVPGASLHREIVLLAEAGLSPMQALRAATSQGAQALGCADLVGTIEDGKRADLVLLDRNPLDDLSNLDSIRWVMKDGVRMTPSWLRSRYAP